MINYRSILKSALKRHRYHLGEQQLKESIKHLRVQKVLNQEEKAASSNAICLANEECLNFYKYVTGNFDTRYVPCWLYGQLENILNPGLYSAFAEHKCNLRFFVPEEHRPTTIIYKMSECIYNANNEIITTEEAKRLLKQEKQFVYKIASGTGGGAGVKFVDINDNPDFDKLLCSNNDFIVQQLIRQHEFMAGLSGGAVNTIRILSLNLNGRCSVLSAFVRMGGLKSRTDNVSGGGVCCGINSEGHFADFGMNHDYDRTPYSPSGIALKGLRIDKYDKIVEFIEKTHRNFPKIHLIAWDVALDEKLNPIIIEVNLNCGRVITHQLFNGPVFGDRSQEVMDYYKTHSTTYWLKL